MKHTVLSISLTALLLGSGCSSIIGATTDSQIVENTGTRSWGALIDDQSLETTATVNIKKAHPELEDAHTTVTSYNGIVLLTGQVPSNAAKQAAGKTVNKLQKTRRLYNEITIAGPISLPARSNDSWITTKAKSKLLASEGVPSNRIKIVTENGIIYMMGLLTREEARISVNAIANTYGAQKIVQIFEYTD
jgi:osmotically-inducible protein OsmY